MYIIKNRTIWAFSAATLALFIGGGVVLTRNTALGGILLVLGASSAIWVGQLIRDEYLIQRKIGEMLRTREWACVFCGGRNFAVLKENYYYVNFAVVKDEGFYSEDRGDHVESFVCTKCEGAAPKELVAEMAKDVP